MENQSLEIEIEDALCISCFVGEHDECEGCSCGDTGCYGSWVARD